MPIMKIFFIVVIWGTYGFCSTFTVDSQTGHILDADGAERFFHGINAVVKSFPWIPNTKEFSPKNSMGTAEDVELLQRLGFNIVRLGVMWPGVQLENGSINNTYLSEVSKIARSNSEANISTILDLHQDAFSERFCGEGVPIAIANISADSRIISSFPEPIHRPYNVSGGIPSKEDCNRVSTWAEYYFTFAVSKAFQSLYTIESTTQSNLKLVWSTIASAVKHIPGILAYELLNEPWPGDIFDNPQLLLPGKAASDNLAPFYDEMATAIRLKDPAALIAFAPVTFADFGPGFKSVPMGPAFANKSMISYHFYSPPNILPAEQMAVMKEAARSLGSGLFLTEFAITNLTDHANSDTELALNDADKYLQSWAGWGYKVFDPVTGAGTIFNNDGTIREDKAKLLTRTYAQIVAGRTQEMRFDSALSTFELMYTINRKEVKLSFSKVYLGKDWQFPNGYSVSLSPEDETSWREEDGKYLIIQHTDSIPDGTVVNLLIRGKRGS